ncbi:hypothetical protein [Hyalangium sp.]|uniref:SitA5 family polymorphic toxin n=1 Tax=Hyalangium sp. TaxID=2028555 RepID=UPI002D578FEF|nr:hypothetical protein [Hyalangium sp.]HYH97319.1 hypothetical protein [Hyalangium sp.]
MSRWAGLLLLFAFLVGCNATTRKVVRLDTGQGAPTVHLPRQDMEPPGVDEDEFKEAVAKYGRIVRPAARPLEFARRLLGVPERSGWYRYEGRSRRLLPSGTGSQQHLRLLPEDEELNRRYLLWCERTWEPGDCLRLLVDSPVLDGDGKYALAMAIAHSKVLGAMKEELGRLVSPSAVVATVVGGLTMYAILLALPEPVSKGVAALLTLGAVGYLGWDTVWRLVDGWLVLMEEVDGSTNFDEIHASGEKFGEVMGEKAARAFVMLGTVVVARSTAGELASTLPTLPGAGQAAVVAESQLGIRFTASALAQVESVAVTAEGVTIALSPNAMAMNAQPQGQQRPRASQVTAEATGQEHHVISKRIALRLEKHTTLQGHYKERDPRFVTRAKTTEDHNGYQKWHREVDKEVIRWLDENPKATPQRFENYLREVYSRPDMIKRFPNGF